MDPQKVIEKFKDKLAREKAPEFEIFFVREHHSEVEAKDQKVNSFEEAETWGASLRVIDRQRLGFAYTTDFSEEGIRRTVEKALATARHSGVSETLKLPRVSKNLSNQNLTDYDNQQSQISPQDRIEMALRLERAALGVNPKVKRVRGASFEGNLQEATLVNSWGLIRHHRKTMNVLSLMAVAEEGGEAEAAFEFGFSSFFQNLNPEEVSLRAAKKALGYLGGRPGPTLKGPILLEALVAAEILEVLAPSFYADNWVKQCSLFEGRLGQKILSPAVTLIDDGCLPGGYASFPFDGEGVARQRIEVVKNGIFQEIMADTEYGGRLKMESTGSSMREGIRRPPAVGHSNFFIPAGKKSPEEILKKMDHGVLITELIGIHTANPISGDFSVGAQGFLVEKGEVKYPIKQIALSGNLKEMMNRVEDAAGDLRFYFKLGSPSLLISEMDVAGE